MVTATQSGVGMNWYDRFSDFPRSPFRDRWKGTSGDGLTEAARRDTPKRDVVLIGRNDFQNKLLARMITERIGCSCLVRSIEDRSSRLVRQSVKEIGKSIRLIRRVRPDAGRERRDCSGWEGVGPGCCGRQIEEE